MTIFRTIIFLHLLTLSFASCSQTKENKGLPSNTYKFNLDTSNFVVLPFDQKFDWIFSDSYKPANLTDEEILQLDTLIRKCATEMNNSLEEKIREYYSIDFKKYNYKRQYIAVFNNKGEKEIWVNGFCNTWNKRWKEELIFVHDGGNCYFNLKINLSTKNCYQISVNGYA
jgi:hypothetical protein